MHPSNRIFHSSGGSIDGSVTSHAYRSPRQSPRISTPSTTTGDAIEEPRPAARAARSGASFDLEDPPSRRREEHDVAVERRGRPAAARSSNPISRASMLQMGVVGPSRIELHELPDLAGALVEPLVLRGDVQEPLSVDRDRRVDVVADPEPQDPATSVPPSSRPPMSHPCTSPPEFAK